MPLDKNLFQFDRSKQNQTGSLVQQETVSAKEVANLRKRNIFQTAICSRQGPSWKEPTTEVDIRKASTIVVDSAILRPICCSRVCHLNLISKLSTIDMIPFGGKYDLRCLAVLFNCAIQHNGKVIRKKEKPI